MLKQSHYILWNFELASLYETTILDNNICTIQPSLFNNLSVPNGNCSSTGYLGYLSNSTKSLASLTLLDLTNNSIKVLPNYIFQDLHLLKHLSLSANKVCVFVMWVCCVCFCVWLHLYIFVFIVKSMNLCPRHPHKQLSALQIQPSSRLEGVVTSKVAYLHIAAFYGPLMEMRGSAQKRPSSCSHPVALGGRASPLVEAIKLQQVGCWRSDSVKQKIRQH